MKKSFLTSQPYVGQRRIHLPRGGSRVRKKKVERLSGKEEEGRENVHSKFLVGIWDPFHKL